MEGYFRGSWVGGVKTGYIYRPNSSASKLTPNPSHSHSFANLNGTEARDIMEGDKKLRSIVWSHRERDEMMLESGESPMSKTGKKKLERTRREIEAEEEERRLAAEQWKGMNDAMGEVEDEIEVEATTAAMGEVAISQQQPWQGNLADRTRD